MDKLTKLAVKYKTDKWGKHNYTPHYFNMFRNKNKRRNVKKVVEMGIAEGAGLQMFRDFFTNAHVYGADIEPQRAKGINLERITLVRCDQTNMNELGGLLDYAGLDIDLFIDDGSHKPEDQVFTCTQLMPLLKNVTYVIEDVANPEIADNFKQYDVKVVECGDRYDDRLIIVKHKNG